MTSSMKIADFLPLKGANSFMVEMAEKQGGRYKVKEKKISLLFFAHLTGTINKRMDTSWS